MKKTNEYLSLPKAILEKATRSGNEYGWKVDDVPEVMKEAKNANLVNLGGQLQYKFSEGTCELYWIDIDPGKRGEEIWETWVERSYKACLEKFNSLMSKYDIRKEAVKNFELLKQKVESGVDIWKHELFILYFERE